MAGSPADRKEEQAATQLPIRGIPQIRTVIRSPVWAVNGDLLLVAVVRVDRPCDRDDQDCAGTRNFTATLKAYFPGLSSRATHLFYSIPDLTYKQAKAQAETSPRCSALR